MTAKPSLPDQSPTPGERLRDEAFNEYFDRDKCCALMNEAAAEIDRLTLALAASEAALSGARTDIERCQEVLGTSAKELIDMRRERDEARRQNPILREQVRELQESMAMLDNAYRAVTEQLSRAATLAATAEVERDALREQLAQSDAVVDAAHEMIEKCLGNDEGYIPALGEPLTRKIVNAVMATGREIVYQRPWLLKYEEDAARKRSEEGLPAQNPRSPVVQTENK